MKTEFALLAVYNRVLIPFTEFVSREMDMHVSTANNLFSKGEFPIRVTRHGNKRFIHVEDAATWIDSARDSQATRYRKRVKELHEEQRSVQQKAG